MERPECFVWVALKEPGPAELAVMKKEFGLHELAVEDAQNGHQRPKIEEYGESIFAVMHTVEMDEEGELLIGDRRTLWYVELADDVAPTARPLPPGVHILENVALGVPSPKVDRVRALVPGPGAVGPTLWSVLPTVLADHTVPLGPTHMARQSMSFTPGTTSPRLLPARVAPF